MKIAIVSLCLTLTSFPLAAKTAPPAAGATASPEKPGGQPYRVGGNVSRPEKISGEPPVYNDAARKSRLQGVVIVEAIIDENGDVTNARILKGLPMGLAESAVQAVSGWKFKPAMLEGRPVPVYYTVTINFQVDDWDPQNLLDLLARDRAAAAPPADAEVLHRLSADLGAKRRTPDEAWHWAQDYHGDSRALVLIGAGSYAVAQAGDPALEPRARAELREIAGKAADLALEAQPDLADAMAFKALVLREKAKGATDPAEKTALADESTRLAKAAYAIYQAAHPVAAPAAP